jgi:hypothetical protein
MFGSSEGSEVGLKGSKIPAVNTAEQDTIVLRAMHWISHIKAPEWIYGRPEGVMAFLDAYSTENIARHAGA